MSPQGEFRGLFVFQVLAAGLGDRLAGGRDTLRAAPRTGPVCAASSPRSANNKVFPLLIAVVETFRGSSVVAVVLPACGLVAGFDGKSVVIGCEAGVDRCTPFPTNGYAGSSVRSERTFPIDGIDAAIEPANWHWPCQAG